MSFNIKKSVEVDYLAARTISSRDFQTNQNAPPGHVLTATASGNARWVFSPPVNSFSRIILPDLSYSTIVGFNDESLNAFQLRASEPLSLEVVSSLNQIIVGGDFSNFISVASLTSTVAGLGQIYISTVAGGGGDLISTVGGLGQIYVSTPSLTSTVAGLGETYTSTSSLKSTVAGLGQTYVSIPSLTSTVAGLGQTYVSIPSLTSTVLSLGNSLNSTVAGLGQTYVSSPSLTSTVAGLGQNYVSVPSLVSTVAGLGQTYVSIPSLTSTVAGLGQTYVSIPSLTSTVTGLGETYVSIPSLTSTVANLGQTYVSIPSLTSTVANLGQTYVSIPSLTSTVTGLGETYVSIPSLTSTVANLGQTYVSIPSLTSTVTGLGQTYVSIPSLTSTVANLGQTYVSIASLTSTVAGLGQTYVSIPSLTSTVTGLGETYVSVPSLTSTVAGLGKTYVSIPSLTSTVLSLGNSLTSTVTGLGQTYVSIPSLTSTVAGLGETYVSIPSLTSTAAGLGQTYVSILSLTSTVAGLGQTYVSTPSLTSTVAGLGQIYISAVIGSGTDLISTVAGLGQIYVSTPSLVSTVVGLGQIYVSTPSLVSTVAGLGQIYVSIPSLTSTVRGISNNLYISSLTTSTFTVTDNARIPYISTIGISSGTITVGTGSAAAPTYSFAGDTNTGIFGPSADVLAFTTGGLERLRINSIGSVGIGKSAAAGYVLDVSGGNIQVNRTGVNAEVDLTAGGGTFSLRRSTGTNGNADVLNTGSGLFSLYTNSISRITIDGLGSVGVGILPSYNFDVSGTGRFTNTLQTDSIISMASGTAAAPALTFTGDTNNGIYRPGADIFAIATAGVERLRVTSGGLVGIGCDPNASYNLDVSGSARINNGGVFFATNTNDAGSITSSGEASFNNKIVYNATRGNGGHIFNVNGGEAMRISSIGLIGINTSTPSFRLDVSGTGHFTQTLQTDSNISMASGTEAAPALTFTGDTDTGVFRPGANRFGITVGGTSRFEISGNDFTMNSYSMYACRAWLNVDASSGVIFTGQNIASVVNKQNIGDVGTTAGYFIAGFTSNFRADSNYSAVVNAANQDLRACATIRTKTTSNMSLLTWRTDGDTIGNQGFCLACFS